MTPKPYSESCDQNKDPILAVLQKEFAHSRRALEIGSGTGQHAVHFGRHLPHLTWQTSDVAIHHEGIRAWLDDAPLPNVLPPLTLDVDDDPWPGAAPAHPCAHGTWASCPAQIDAVFSANTTHIMSWPQVERMFTGIGHVLQGNGVFCLYGPFNYGGTYTSPSNARFDMWLKARDPLSGIRDVESLDGLAQTAGMSLLYDYAMPANNRTLVWRKA